MLLSHLVSSGYQAIVSVEYAESHAVLVPAHESHEEAVVPDVVGAHDDQVEQVPHPAVLHVLDHQLPHQVVRVVAVSVQKRRQQTQELALLKKNSHYLIVQQVIKNKACLFCRKP